ncbi:putative HMP/thiamine import ATP-binding protein YkoD [compost metagenome]
MKREIKPEGKSDGEILYRGCALEQLDVKTSIEEIGIVFQDPDNQIVMNTVWQELSFAMENLGYPAEQIQRRLGELVKFFGMEEWLHLPVHELSGGQKQMVNLASVMSLRPKVLLLDEPTAQLDPIAARHFIQLLARLNEELSLTIIMSEHRVEELFPIATQIVMLLDGKLVYEGEPQVVMQQIWNHQDAIFQYFLPSVSHLYLSVEKTGNPRIPLTVKDARKWLNEQHQVDRSNAFLPITSHTPETQEHDSSLLVCQDLYFQYDKNTRHVHKRLSLTIKQGEFFVLFGGNGSGKSTLLHQIAGALKPQRGTIYYDGKAMRKYSVAERSRLIGYVAQNPLLYFTRDTIQEQLKDRLQRLGKAGEKQKLDELLALFEIEDIVHKHPYDISGGQQQKVALALVLLAEPKLLLLDEPTKGLDPLSKLKLAGLLAALRERGTTMMMVSHDIEFAASHATRCGLLFDGAIVAEQETRSFLQDNYFYTTIIHRAVGEYLPTALTVKDVWNQWGISNESFI